MALRQSGHSHTRRDSVRRDISGTDTTTSRFRSRMSRENSCPQIRMTMRYGAATTELSVGKLARGKGADVP